MCGYSFLLSVFFSSSLAPKFLQALKDLGDVDEEAISETHLRGEYGKIQQQVLKTLHRFKIRLVEHFEHVQCNSNFSLHA